MDLDSQLFSTGWADPMRCPFRLPDQIDFYLAYLRNACQAVMNLLKDESAGWALRSRQSHGDFDALPGKGWSGVGIWFDGNTVDQTEIDKIELYLRVEAIVQRGEDVICGKNGQLLKRTTACHD